MRLAALGAIALAAAAARAAPARADDGAALLDRARRAIDQVDYEGARKLADRALDAGHLAADDLARAHQLAGEIAAALGDADGARDHFVRWLLLDPDASLPAGASPKLTEPFDAARAQAAHLGPMHLDVTATRAGARVTIALDGPDPLHLAARLRVSTGGAAPTEGPAPRLDVDAGDATFSATVEVLDDRGDVLARRGVTALAATAPAVPAAHHRVPAAVRWPTWTGLAVVAAGAGAYFGWRVGKDGRDLDALNAASPMHTYDEARAIEDRGRRDALVTNVAIGVAAAAAAAAVVTFVVDRRTVEVAPLAAPGAAGATAAVRF